jgi:hypothetical protein
MRLYVELAAKTERIVGLFCAPEVPPDANRDGRVQIAEVAQALRDPVRLQQIDVMRKHAGKVDLCVLVPVSHLFELKPDSVWSTVPASSCELTHKVGCCYGLPTGFCGFGCR